MKPLCSFALSGLLLALAHPSFGADWPAYKRDPARSSVSSETLTLPLAPSWSWQGPAPAPAWDEPGRSLNPLDFDYANQPVVAGGIVVVNSSSDDTVRGFDAATGALKWSYTVGAPVRLAPQLDGGKCYFAADDGVVRCLNAATGAEVWAKRVGLDGSLVMANGRLASRWPCRSGVLVRDGVLYVTAGMWPSEGVYVYALDAATGAERWCNDTSCYEYIEYPHVPSAAFGGPAPQGALLATSDLLVVPTGRGVPGTYDLKTGKLVQYRADSEVSHLGGTWASVLENNVFVTAVGWMPDVPPRLGESPEHFADSLVSLSARTGKQEWAPVKAMQGIAPEWKMPWRGRIGAGLYGRTRAVLTPERVFAFGNGMGDAWEIKGASASLKWSVPRARVYSEALTANALVLGEDGRLAAVDPATGKDLWQVKVDGQVRGIAIADGRIYAATSKGALHVFAAGGQKGTSTSVAKPAVAAPALPASLTAAVEKAGQAKGVALVLGGRDASLAQAIAARTNFHVVTLLADAKAVAAERARLVGQTSLYGTRVSVASAEGARLPSYAANLIVVVGDAAGIPQADWYRVLRPCGGVLASADGALKPPAGLLPGEAQGSLVVRGKLPGSFDWDGKVQADERVKWPLEFTWFGEPNGQLQKPRHQRPRTPLAANGRMFIFGENTITAIDGYNGTELWRQRVDGSIGQDAPVYANNDSLYCGAGAGVARFDAATGKLLEVFADKPSSPPVIDASKPVHIDGAMRNGAGSSVDIENSATALRIVLGTKSPAPQADDAWELAFDFRPAAQRVNAASQGYFELVVNATPGTLRAHQTLPHPAPQVEKLSDGRVALTFAWAEIEKWAGWKPTDFNMAADCKLWQAKLDLALWDKPLTNGRGRGINEAMATIVLAGKAAGEGAGVLSSYLPAPLKPMASSPWKPTKDKLFGLPLLAQRRPNGDTSDFGAAAGKEDAKMSVLPRARGFELPTRTEPFSGATGSADYTPSYGCSGIISSAVMDFMRSGSIGMYDRADDSGMRNISGIRSGCGQTLLPALGMLLYAEGTGNCLCTYNFATSFGMAPAGGRRNEDWALFNDENVESTGLNKIAFNFGAPGDRRDDKGMLWIALPRPGVAVKLGTALTVPATMDVAEGAGPFRINTDRKPVAGTDKPWLYGSNIRGLNKFHLDLQFYEPGGTVLSVLTTAPQIDGELKEACWNGFGGAPTSGGKGPAGTVYMRHDAEKLYIGAKGGNGFALTFGDPKTSSFISLAVAGTKVDVKRMDVPDYDRKVPPQTLPDVTPVAAELPGVVAASASGTEVAIPWKSLEALGLTREKLRASPNPVQFFGKKAPDILRNFSRSAFAVKVLAAAPPAAKYTVRMHFAEIEGAAAGERVCDVQLNGQTVAAGLDVVRDAGGPMKALVKEFKGVAATSSLDIALLPKGGKAAPILSALEIVRE